MKTSIINFAFSEFILSYCTFENILFCRVFVGTVSEFCAKHAECPVITIKRSAAESPQDPVDD